MVDALKIATEMPHKVQVWENVWIPMSDGTHLAARIWLPENAEAQPVPAVLEYIPYRKRDSTRARDDLHHSYFAGHGYAGVRVDLRGSGDSEGLLEDEYLQQELDDGVEVIAWLARQSWCSGEVGMIGISWGGFNGLQIAAMRPPELKAVISVCSTDDRYADDVHHMGGCLLGDNLSWASVMFAYNSLPPDPMIVGDEWRDLWLQRLKANKPWLKTWLEHQTRDDYWKHGSICEQPGAVEVPVMAVSGWADGYSNAVFRLLSQLKGPRQGLVGPWSHKYPYIGEPGPAIGFLQEAVRWWDYWLKGKATGIMDEPMLRAFMQDSVPPYTRYLHRPGSWVGEPEWPSSNIQTRRYPLVAGLIAMPDDDSQETQKETARSVQSPLTLGLFAGKWCSYAGAPDLPHDQREEDGGAMVFESEPLTEEIDILGAPLVELEVSSDQPNAQIAVRLSDVAPDDKATRVTYGLLNLSHRESREFPSPLEPGKRYRVRLRLNDIAQRFPAGNRLRLSLSTSYFPLAWPSPEPVRLKVYSGSNALELPVRARRASDKDIGFEKPLVGGRLKQTQLEAGHHNWWVKRDLAQDIASLEVINDQGLVRIDELDLEHSNNVSEIYSLQGDEPNSVRGEVVTERGLRRKNWSVWTHTRTVLTSTPNHFYIRAELDAYEGEERIYSNNWRYQIARDKV